MLRLYFIIIETQTLQQINDYLMGNEFKCQELTVKVKIKLIYG